jgi:hypothetical protein
VAAAQAQQRARQDALPLAPQRRPAPPSGEGRCHLALPDAAHDLGHDRGVVLPGSCRGVPGAKRGRQAAPLHAQDRRLADTQQAAPLGRALLPGGERTPQAPLQQALQAAGQDLLAAPLLGDAVAPAAEGGCQVAVLQTQHAGGGNALQWGWRWRRSVKVGW